MLDLAGVAGLTPFFIYSIEHAVMVGSGVPLMQSRVHGPIYDTEEQHGGQSSLLDLLINGVKLTLLRRAGE